MMSPEDVATVERIKEVEGQETLLSPASARSVLYPIRFDNIWTYYKLAIGAFWTSEEIDLSKDREEWENRLTENERHFIKNILAFFASSDVIVANNIDTRFIKEVQILEAQFFYGFQTAIENIHSEVYSVLIDTYVKDVQEKHRLLNAVETIPWVQRKAEWGMKWSKHEDAPFAQRLLAFAIMEGVGFSAAFCSIFWLKERGLLPGLCFANALISRDESLHAEFAVLLYSMLENRLPQTVVYAMIESAIEVEEDFVRNSLSCDLIGMNQDLMVQYVHFVADRLVVQLGYAKLYNAVNPFSFMDRIGLELKDNFFESRVQSYSKANVGGSAKNVHEFSVTDEF